MKMSELRKMIREVILEAGTSGIAGHTGRKGQDIDDYAAGPFRPDKTLTIPLKNQIAETKRKRGQIKESPEQKWVRAHINLEYDDVPSYAGKEYANETNDYKSIDVDHGFDKNLPKYADSKFVNDTQSFKIINENKAKSALRNMIRDEIREASTSVGGTGTKSTIDTKSAEVDTKQSEYDKAVSVRNSKEREYSKKRAVKEPTKYTTSTTHYTRGIDGAKVAFTKGQSLKLSVPKSWTKTSGKTTTTHSGTDADYTKAKKSLGKGEILSTAKANDIYQDVTSKWTDWNNDLETAKTAWDKQAADVSTKSSELEKLKSDEKELRSKSDVKGDATFGLGTRGSAGKGRRSSRAGGGANVAGGVSKASLSGFEPVKKGKESGKGDDEDKNESLKNMKIKVSRIQEIVREEIKSLLSKEKK